MLPTYQCPLFRSSPASFPGSVYLVPRLAQLRLLLAYWNTSIQMVKRLLAYTPVMLAPPLGSTCRLWPGPAEACRPCSVLRQVSTWWLHARAKQAFKHLNSIPAEYFHHSDMPALGHFLLPRLLGKQPSWYLYLLPHPSQLCRAVRKICLKCKLVIPLPCLQPWNTDNSQDKTPTP